MTIGLTLKELLELPPPQMIEELDANQLIDAMVADLKTRHPEVGAIVDLESEPIRKLIEVFAYRETVLRARINDVYRANLLGYSQGTDLDNLAAFYDLTRLQDESDDRFRERTVLAIAGRSPGGTGPRYRSIAMQADIRVSDALAYTLDKDPTVYVSIFSTENDGLATPDLIENVRFALNAEEVRMVNDKIEVVAAVTVVQDIELDVWFLPSAPASLEEDLKTIIKDTWNIENGLGKDLVHSWIIRAAMQQGVMRLEVLEPSTEHLVIEPYKSLSLGEVKINNRGTDQ